MALEELPFEWSITVGGGGYQICARDVEMI